MKTHWKKLTNPDYLGAYDFQPDEERIVQIASVSREMVTGPDGKKEECTVAKLKGSKPMILNSTNSKSITQALGTPYIEDWAGKSITIFTQKVRAFGETVDALRIRPTAPVIKKPALTPSHEKWEGAKKAIKDGNITIDQIKEKFELSRENEKLLVETKPEVA